MMSLSSTPSPDTRTLPPPSATPVVFVVDADTSMRETLQALVRGAGWQPETFATPSEFLSRPRLHSPSCLVLDIHLPDLNGLRLQQRLAVERAEMPIICITGNGDVPMTVRAMKTGAVDVLTKPLADAQLLGAVEHALRRSRTTLAKEAEFQELRHRRASLSRREQEVMALVVSGLPNKQIAWRLGISEVTVKAHRGKVMRKMKARSLADLVRMTAIAPRPHGPSWAAQNR
jgi:FixJ family two-component response regulator